MSRYEVSTYEKVFENSTNLFLTNGFEKTTVRMILDDCGIHSGSLYYLFSSKEEILKTAMEAFYGDILCRSGRLSRSSGHKELIIVFPTAFLLYASSMSNKLARLLYQAHNSWPIMNKMQDMASFWTNREGVSDLDTEELRSNFLFLLGGVGNMIGEYCYGTPEDYRILLKRFAKTTYGMLKMDPFEDLDHIVDLVHRSVIDEELTFIDRPINRIDEVYSENKEKETEK